MNEKEEETPLEDSHIHQNRLAWEKHVVRFEEQCATNASWRAAQKVARNNVQIATDASQTDANQMDASR
jgi:hypothetical protein